MTSADTGVGIPERSPLGIAGPVDSKTVPLGILCIISSVDTIVDESGRRYVTLKVVESLGKIEVILCGSISNDVYIRQ